MPRWKTWPRAIAALVVTAGCLAPATVWAQRPAPAPARPPETRAVQIDYHVHVIGLKTFTIESMLRIDGDRYQFDVTLRNEGLLRAVTASFEGRNRAIGGVLPTAPRPESGYSGMAIDKFQRTWLVAYRGDGSFAETHANYDQPKELLVSDEQKRGAFDPATAIMVGLLKATEPCDRTVPVFDSKRRFDVTIARVRTEPLPGTPVPGMTGDALLCEARLKKIAGYGNENPKDDATGEEPIRVWLGQLDDSGRWYPVRVTFSTGWGTLTARIQTLVNRDLTAEDRKAMGR